MGWEIRALVWATAAMGCGSPTRGEVGAKLVPRADASAGSAQKPPAAEPGVEAAALAPQAGVPPRAEPPEPKVEAGTPEPEPEPEVELKPEQDLSEEPPLTTCGELRADLLDDRISECEVLDTIKSGGHTVEVLELSLDDPAVDALRAVYIAMNDGEDETHFESIVEGQEVPGETVDYELGKLEPKGGKVQLAYTQTTTTYITEGPGPMRQADREIDELVVLCDLDEQLCQTQ